MDREHIETFIYRAGLVTGALHHPDVVAHLKARGASAQEIEAARAALLKLFEYRA